MTDLSGDPYPDPVRNVLKILDAAGTAYQIRSFSEPAQRASQAARLLGCPLGAVVKSLLFQGETTGDFILALVSGANRADPRRISQISGQDAKPASPHIVKEATGYPVGAVPPFGFRSQPKTLMDQDLTAYQEVWASGGAAQTLVGLAPGDLARLCQAQVAEIREE